MKTTFTEAEYAVEEAEFRAETENAAMALVAYPDGYAVRPLTTVRKREKVIETFWPELFPRNLGD